MIQRTFNPVDYKWEWTEGWYRWDRTEAHKLALQARNQAAKAARKAGYTVQCFSLRDQLITRGGIGSKHSQIEQVVTCYGVNIY